MNRRTLRCRFMRPVVLAIAAITLIGVCVDTLVSMAASRRALASASEQTASAIDGLIRDNRNILSMAMRAELSREMALLCASQNRLAYCCITDVSRRIIAHSQKENIGKTINPALLSHRRDYGQRRETLVTLGDFLETVAPIERRGQWLGTIHVGVARQYWTDAEWPYAWMRWAALSLVATIAAVVVTTVIKRRILGPIIEALPEHPGPHDRQATTMPCTEILSQMVRSIGSQTNDQQMTLRMQDAVLRMCTDRHVGLLAVDVHGQVVHRNEAFDVLWRHASIGNIGEAERVIAALAGACHGTSGLQLQWTTLQKGPSARASGSCHTKWNRVLEWESVPIVGDNAMCFGRLWAFRSGNSPRLCDELLGGDIETLPLLNLVSDMLCYMDATLTIRWMNRPTLDLLGVTLDEAIGKKCHELWHHCDHPCPNCPVIDSITQRDVCRRQVTDTTGRSTDITAHPILDTDRAVVGVLEILQNVTTVVQVERELQNHQENLEALVRERTEELNTLVDMNPSGMVIVDATSECITRVNKALCEMTGASPSELINQRCDVLGEAVYQTLAGDVPSGTTETVLHTHFVTDIPVTRTLSRFSIMGRPHVLISFTDISDRKAFESRLTTRNEELHTMNQTLQASEFVLRTQNRELSGRMRELNCLFELGKVIASSNASLDQVFEKSMTILTEAVQYPQLACVRITFEDQGFSTANFHDTEWSMEATISQGDRVYGQIVVCYLQKPADMSGSAFLTEENALLSSFAAQLAQLIERHKAEQTLQENESRFRTLVANVPGAVYRALPDSDRTMNYISQAIVDIAGYAPADFMSGGTRTYMSIVHPDDTEMVLQSIRQASQEGLPYAIEYRLIHSDGWLRWVYDKGHCVHDGHRLMWLDGAVFDITNRKNTEDTLTRQKDLLGNILSTIPLFVSWKDRNLTYMGCNDAMARAAGYSSPQDIIGKTDIDMPWTVEQVEEYQDSDRQVLSTGRPLMNMEEKQTLIDGSERTILTSKVPLRNPQSEVIGVLTIGVDITDRKLLESQLIQAQKLESIGQLASGIAHEINTPTQYIGDNVRFLRDKIADIVELLSKHTHLMERLKEQNVCADLIAEIEEETKEVGLDFLCEEIPLAINDSLDGIDRVTDIVRAMKEFSHPGVEGKAEQDLNRAIHNTITVARNRWKYVAEMETHFDPKLPSVTCLINEINQVILNLIVNAADAIADRLQGRTDERGKITVSTRHVKNKVEIRISDTGTGIPQEIRSRVFDPFFTTKEVGKGTGQGLAICHDIIKKKHGGEIFFESETGKGTTFVIRLPLDVDADKSIDTGEVDTCPKTQ